MTLNQKKFLCGGLLVLSGVSYLMYAGLQGSTVYYVTVEEFLAQQETLSGEGIRIAGTVAENSIQRRSAMQEVTFVLRGNSRTALMPVYYKGIVPDIFRDGASVVLEGVFNVETRQFQATTLMTSCPSKYESKLK